MANYSDEDKALFAQIRKKLCDVGASEVMDKLDLMMQGIQDRLKSTEDRLKSTEDRLKSTEDRLKSTEDRLTILDDIALMPVALNIAHNLCSDAELGLSGYQRQAESSRCTVRPVMMTLYEKLFGKHDIETKLQTVKNERHVRTHGPEFLMNSVKKIKSSNASMKFIQSRNYFLKTVIDKSNPLITIVLSVGVISLCRKQLQTVEADIMNRDEQSKKNGTALLTGEQKRIMREQDYNTIAKRLADELKLFRNSDLFSESAPFLTDDVIQTIEADLSITKFPVPEGKYSLRADERRHFLEEAIDSWHEDEDLRQASVPGHPECTTILLLSNLLLGIADSSEIRKPRTSNRPIRLSKKSTKRETMGYGAKNVASGPASKQFQDLMSTRLEKV